jgi:hypothetical protein
MNTRINQFREFFEESEATLPCHRCGKTQFAIIDGDGSFAIRNYKGTGTATQVDICLVVCGACGAVTPHAAGALDMFLSKKKQVN